MFKHTNNHKMRKAVLGLAIGVASVMVPMGAAAASVPAGYPANSGTLTVNDTTVTAGQAVEVTGDGFAPGAEVALEFRSTPVSLGSASATGGGVLSTTVTIPASASTGTHTIVATGEGAAGGTLVLSAEITVEGAGGGGLAFTGGNTWALAVAALGAMAVGWLLISVTRRPSTTSA